MVGDFKRLKVLVGLEEGSGEQRCSDPPAECEDRGPVHAARHPKRRQAELLALRVRRRARSEITAVTRSNFFINCLDIADAMEACFEPPCLCLPSTMGP